jgi:hypothetical protein
MGIFNETIEFITKKPAIGGFLMFYILIIFSYLTLLALPT